MGLRRSSRTTARPSRIRSPSAAIFPHGWIPCRAAIGGSLKILALSHTTGEVAKRFRVSAGRISQLRRDLQRSWEEFQGEATPDERER